jgi:uncharacterized protein YndB with AHSA1/START domain
MSVWIAIAVVVLIVALLAFAATRPDTFRIDRATRISAPPERVFALINDLHSWPSWSPWEKLDPAMKRTYSSAESGKGAVYEWSGNSKAGAGRMEITDTSPPSRVTIKLDFLKPFESHSTIDFTLETSGGSTNVTWAMHGPSPFTSKLMGLFLNMDKLIGKDFESGLASMKAIAEK